MCMISSDWSWWCVQEPKPLTVGVEDMQVGEHNGNNNAKKKDKIPGITSKLLGRK